MKAFFLAIAITMFSICQAADITVSPGGSISAAFASANAGDRVLVNAGTYNENILISKSGTVAAYITLKANGAVKINSGGGGKAIRIAASYIIIDGFELTNYQCGVNFRTGHHVQVLNCNVHSGTSIGTAVSGSNGIETNYDPGPIDNIYVENTDFYYNANGGGDLGCNSASDVLTNITFKKCKFYANACGGGTDGIGIGHFGTKANISFIRCEAYDNLSDGFDVDAPVFMDGCIAHDNDKNGGPNWGVGIKAWASGGGQVRLYNCVVYNNTEDTDGGGGINIGGTNSVVSNCLVSNNRSYAGIIISTGATVTVKNTIFYNEKHAFSEITTGVNFDSSNIINSCIDNGGLSASDAAKAKTFNPMFVSSSSGDFRLNSVSSAIDAGVAVTGVTIDADGNNRAAGLGVDIGPYEYGSGTTVITSTGGSGTSNSDFKIKISPNPWNPNLNSGDITISDVPLNKQFNLKIFNSTGELIKSLSYGGIGVFKWDGKDEDGNAVSRGIYYVSIEGEGKSRAKIALIK